MPNAEGRRRKVPRGDELEMATKIIQATAEVWHETQDSQNQRSGTKHRLIGAEVRRETQDSQYQRSSTKHRLVGAEVRHETLNSQYQRSGTKHTLIGAGVKHEANAHNLYDPRKHTHCARKEKPSSPGYYGY